LRLSIKQVLEIFEIDPATMPDITTPTSDRELMEKNTKEFRDKLKSAYRKLAMKHHPDLANQPGYNGDPEKFKKITEIYDFCQKNIRVVNVQRRHNFGPIVIMTPVVVIRRYSSSGSSSATTSSFDFGLYTWE
jgi:preprotein translocase subunit Sec63